MLVFENHFSIIKSKDNKENMKNMLVPIYFYSERHEKHKKYIFNKNE